MHIHISMQIERIEHPVNTNKATPDSDRNSILLAPRHQRTHSEASDLALLTVESL